MPTTPYKKSTILAPSQEKKIEEKTEGEIRGIHDTQSFIAKKNFFSCQSKNWKKARWR